jgi:hypothetical protein
MFDKDIQRGIKIYRAEVLRVDRERGVCDLVTLDSESRGFSEVPWSSPFTGGDGNGFDFCPSERQQCYLLANTYNAQESRSISSVILGWCFPENNDAFGFDRERMYRNDVKLSTRRGAKLLLDANRGDLLMQSGPSCGITLYRLANLLEILTDSYVLNTRGGEVTWSVDGESDDEDQVRYSCHIKSKAGDEIGFMRVLVSSDGISDFFDMQLTEPALGSGQFIVDDTSDIYQRPDVYAKLRFSTDGSGIVHTGSRLDISANDKLSFISKGEVSTTSPVISGLAKDPYTSSKSEYIVTPELANIFVDSLEIRALEVNVVNRATGELLLRAADDTVHDEAKNRRLFNEDLAEWLFNHTHPSNGMPPIGRPEDVPCQLPGVPGADTQELTEAIERAETNAKRSLEMLSILCTLNKHLCSAITAVGGVASIEAAVVEMIAIGVLPQNSTTVQLYSKLDDSAEEFEEERTALTNNSAVDMSTIPPSLTETSFGVSSVNEVLTKDTKVR